MNASDPTINRDDVIAELDSPDPARHRSPQGTAEATCGLSLIAWKSALEDDRQSVTKGAITEAQVSALVDQGCRLAGAFPADQVGNRGLHTVWMTTGEDMSSNLAMVQHLGRLMRTQANGGDESP